MTDRMKFATDHLSIAPNDIAVVGMSCRLPGARNPDDFWRNLRDGVESITRLTTRDLRAGRVDPELLRHPDYVKYARVLDDVDQFDAGFFGFSPKEAAIMDPQHRHFLEIAWEALEHAGYAPELFDGNIGVFAGCGMNSYMMFNLLTNPDLIRSTGMFLIRHTGNDKDFLTTRVSYCLDLRGPSVNVQTACSTSLVAVHQACQSLLNGECDMAMAGGVTIELPHRVGYLYQESEILSPDGHCRAFDHRSQGTVFGSGAGAVVLRRLEDAIADGDTIHAIVKGSAINNDGAGKVGYLAPSVDGQAAAITEALAVADVPAESISVVEAHGTGTPVGDPMEVTALTQAFRTSTDQSGYCALGSVKTNIGHLDTAAGIAGFIKNVLALEHRQIPPSLNFEAPNPAIDFDHSPFFVNDSLRDWQPPAGFPRRAGINSLGVGGTNAHVILEEAPELPPVSESRPWQLLTFSARSPEALDRLSDEFAHYLQTHPDLNLADAAFTLKLGRRSFPHRRIVACRSVDDALEALTAEDRKRVVTAQAPDSNASVVFMFPGGGAQYPEMGRDLYESEPVYREAIDACFAALEPGLAEGLRALIFPEPGNAEEAAAALQSPLNSVLSIFIVEYATAQLLMAWGVEPSAMIGHSLGEYTAACLAETLSLADALTMVVIRGRIFEKLPHGGMLSVQLSEEKLRPYLGDRLEFAAVNAPDLTVVSGSDEELQALATRLSTDGIESTRVRIDVAAHSRMLDPFLEEFRAGLRSITLAEPRIPFLSNLTGTWISPDDAADPEYWVRQLRHTVRFAESIGELLKEDNRVLLEVGPGKTLSSLCRAHPDCTPQVPVFGSMRHPQEAVSDYEFALRALGRLWMNGVDVDWRRFYKNELRRRIPLPTYPFEHQRYWIDPGEAQTAAARAIDPVARIPDPEDWLSRPVWVESGAGASAVASLASRRRSWLLFADEAGLALKLRDRLEAENQQVTLVRFGEAFRRTGTAGYSIDPADPADYDALLSRLIASDQLPDHVLHLGCIGAATMAPESDLAEVMQRRGFYSLLFLAQALIRHSVMEPIGIDVITAGLFAAEESDTLSNPLQAAVLGPVRVLPREMPNLNCRAVDLPAEAIDTDDDSIDTWLDRILELSLAGSDHALVALRDERRLVLERQPLQLSDAPESEAPGVREGGVYLITGGLGGLGLALAEYLSRHFRARLVLVSRRELPPVDTWDDYLARHDYSDPQTHQILKIRKLESLGSEVLHLSADISEPDHVRRIFAEAVEKFGGLNGVFHAAGVLDDGLVAMKEPYAPEEVFAPKVHGTLLLDEQLRTRPEAEFLVLFSSTSAWLGLPGQIDYVSANAFMDAFAQSRASMPGPRVVAIDWGTWAEVGMAVSAARSMGLIDSEGDGRSREHAHPLLERCIVSDTDRHVFSATLSRAATWMLEEHGIKGKGRLLPGTGYIELARAAGHEIFGPGPLELHDLMFIAPLAVGPETRLQIRTSLTRSGDGFEFQVSSRAGFDTEGHELWQDHCRGLLRRGQTAHARVHSIEAIAARCNNHFEEFDGIRPQSKQEDHLHFGPRWKNLKWTRFGVNEAIASLELPRAFVDDLETYQAHPALLDIATGFALPLVEGYESCDKLYVPVVYGSIRILGPLPPQIYVHVRNHGANTTARDIATFDITVMDGEGVALVEIESFVAKRIDDMDTIEIHVPESADRAGADQEFNLLRLGVERGIRPSEGMDLLVRLLSLDLPPQVVVSSLDLDALLERALPAAPVERPSRRREGESFHAPAGEVEKKIAAIWSQHLGVENVGRSDEFFELGGHSLLGMRVIIQINSEFRTSFPASELFEHPTVAKLAEKICTERPELAEEHADERMAVPSAVAAPEEPSSRRVEASSRTAPRTGSPAVGPDVKMENGSNSGSHAGNGAPSPAPVVVSGSVAVAQSHSAQTPATPSTDTPPQPPASDRPPSAASADAEQADIARLAQLHAMQSSGDDHESDAPPALRRHTGEKSFGMRRSWFAQKILAPLYKMRRHRFRSMLEYLILKLEGGEWYTVTLRELYAKHYDLHIGDYSASCFNVSQMKRGTRIGRYCSIFRSVRIETANHPTNTISSNGIFYQKVGGFADGYSIPRVQLEIGNDVWIGHNATILYPTRKIGDGAVIAAGAVVAGDVPPFAIVAGYPATVIRYRFSREKIDQIMKSKWWEASLEELETVKEEFTRPVEGQRVR